jgi:FkbM family methyltransferase
MTITSYAQNFEDVMLWRALGHVESGMYVDVGAQDPVIDSVSLAFHEHGWQGIHVEPTPHYAALLRQQRPGDTVIQAAVGQGPAVMQFFEIPDSGISTADADIAAQHRERGFKVREITVPCIPLDEVFKTCAEREIHWLKIDVEGFEKQVLSSWGSSAARPWIVVVESTLPLTQIETHESWEPIVIAYGYAPVYFDGLNRYYVSDAHPELKGAFRVPPNVFDGFTLNGTASTSFHTLIETRAQEKVTEALALLEQERRSTVSEIERLNLSHSSLDKAHAKQEQALTQQLKSGQEELHRLELVWIQREKEQAGQTRKELESLLRSQAQREQEIGAQLQALQQQAAKELVEQVRSHSEDARALHHQHAEREQALTQQLQAGQQELQNLQKDRAKHEQEIGVQLLTSQRQAARDTADQARMHREQVKALQRQHAEREGANTQQLTAGQQEIRRLEQDRSQREKEHAGASSQSRQALENMLGKQLQREQEVIALLLVTQQQAVQENTEQARQHGEQERTLLRQHAAREQALIQQQEAAREELRQQEHNWAQHEKALGKEIAKLQGEAQKIGHAQELQAQQNEAQLSTRLNEHNRLIEVCAAIEVQLKAEILLEQQTNLRLRQSLIAVKQSLATTHSALTWRITAPLRTLASFIAPKKNHGGGAPVAAVEIDAMIKDSATPQPISTLQASVEPAISASAHAANSNMFASEIGEGVLCSAITPPVSDSSLINIQQQKTIEPTMLSSTQANDPTSASTLDELLAYHDQNFIHCAYRTLLGRAPDPEGLGYYLRRLRAGFSKIYILAQLRLSKEGKSHGVKLTELDIAIQRYQKSKYPLIGWLFRRLYAGEGDRSTERKLRGVENQIFLLSDENNRRFNQLEIGLAGLHNLVAQQTQSVVVAMGGTLIAVPDTSSGTPIPPPEHVGFKQLSLRAKDIYFQLKTAAAAHVTRVA